MEPTGSVRYRRGTIRAVTPDAIAEQLAEIRRVASAFGVKAVAPHLEQTAKEALAVARTDEGEYGAMVLVTLVGAFVVVLAFGAVVLGLPWYAAAIAGAIVGVTSYPRRNPEHPAHRLDF